MFYTTAYYKPGVPNILYSKVNSETCLIIEGRKGIHGTNEIFISYREHNIFSFVGNMQHITGVEAKVERCDFESSGCSFT